MRKGEKSLLAWIRSCLVDVPFIVFSRKNFRLGVCGQYAEVKGDP